MTAPLIINGWTLYAHPLFLAQLNKRIDAVIADKQKNPENYAKKANAKILKAISDIIFNRIPQDPTLPRYRQGDALGGDYKHWFRDKFFQQYRLFFRYDQTAKIIVYAWINNERSLRSYGSKTDAYAVFADMLHDGNPPDNWDALLAAAQSKQAQQSFAGTIGTIQSNDPTG